MKASDPLWLQTLWLGAVHLMIAIPAIAASVACSIPLARLALAHRVAGFIFQQSVALLFAVPALPLLIVVPRLTGIPVTSPVTLIVLLTLYGIAVMVRHISAAFESIPPDVALSARALGYGHMARLHRIEFPLAWPSIIQSLRVVSASTMSMTVGAIVGVPGLGLLITRGYDNHDWTSIAAGTLATVVVALALDVVIVRIGKATTPWVR